ncbi:hypothetical protein LPJ53_005457 [Coemansia erecta]|uniref:Biotin carboxylation domain-containing protein n=1 Tax=Coemansia erecta TaxID=147472 RepID=A0A9W7XSF4_9FUNG|nr:hypothetical protein LPJ53_005457 [Coemansia erecta]
MLAPTKTSDVRVKTGMRLSDEIPVHYDPVIAKLVVYASDRADILRNLRKALASYQVIGVHTDFGFLSRLAASADFAAAKHRDELLPPAFAPPAAGAMALTGLTLLTQRAHVAGAQMLGGAGSPWAAMDGFGVNTPATQHIEVASGKHLFHVENVGRGSGAAGVRMLEGAELLSKYPEDSPTWTLQDTGGSLRALLGSRQCCVTVVYSRQSSRSTVPQSAYALVANAHAANNASVAAPMSCKIVQVLVDTGKSLVAFEE